MEPAVRDFIERLGSHLAGDGLPLIAGRVTAYLLVSEGPRSLDEIAGALGVSRASISTDTRRLVDKGLLVRGSLPGDRRTYYTFAPDGFRTMLAARIRSLSTLRALLDDASALPSARTSPEVRHRLAEWTDFHTAAIDLLQALLTRRAASDTSTSRQPAVA